MTVKNIVDEDFINYKKSSMFVIMPFCTFKCDNENGTQSCQNWSLTKEPNIEIEIDKLIKRYLDNPISKAIVFGGLEPFDSFGDIARFISKFRISNDDVVIYTGYSEDEIKFDIDFLRQFDNIIIKFGRYRPNQEKHFDELLGVYLPNDEQYAKILEK